MIEEAQKHYNFANPHISLIRHNENMTYLVDDEGKKYVLRIHKSVEGLDLSKGSGNQKRELLIQSEIELLQKISLKGDLLVQRPIANNDNKFITYLKNGTPVTVLSWIEGEDLRNFEINDDLSFRIGQMIARLHKLLKDINSTNRYCYDDLYLHEISTNLSDAYQRKHIGSKEYEIIQEALCKMKSKIINEKENMIFIHADLSKSNIILSGDSIFPIDFSLAGLGFAEQDLADMNWTLHNEKLSPNLYAGYESMNKFKINQSRIRMYTVLYPISYISSHHKTAFQEHQFQDVVNHWVTTIIEPYIIYDVED